MSPEDADSQNTAVPQQDPDNQSPLICDAGQDKIQALPISAILNSLSIPTKSKQKHCWGWLAVSPDVAIIDCAWTSSCMRAALHERHIRWPWLSGFVEGLWYLYCELKDRSSTTPSTVPADFF